MRAIDSKILSRCFLSVTMCFATTANAEPMRGGQGILRPVIQGMCFKTFSPAVPEVCGSIEIRWKFWTLVGEPIGNYVLLWKLSGIRIKSSSDNSAPLYSISELPPSLAKAARQSELYIDGIAHVETSHKEFGTVVLPFNTGVSVKPDSGASMNIPSGYSWNETFVNGTKDLDLSLPMNGWCDPKNRAHTSPEISKKIVSGGFKLNTLQICPSTAASAQEIDSAISLYCEESKIKVEYCPNGLDQKPRNIQATQSTKRETISKKAVEPFAEYIDDKKVNDMLESAFEAAEAHQKSEASAKTRAQQEAAAKSKNSGSDFFRIRLTAE